MNHSMQAIAVRVRFNRAGFTLLEMMLSVSIMLIVFAIAIPFFRTQLQAMDVHAGRYEAQQNARFGAATIERELRVAGAGLPDAQPMIVQANQHSVTFNADLASSISGSVTAVYFDPDLPAVATTSMNTGSKVTLPLSTALYPLANYTANSIASPAETISFWVAPDTLSDAQPGTYALYRRVNSVPATIVARNLVLKDALPTFTYQMINTTTGLPFDIDKAKLPLTHVATHGATNDTGSTALTDSIRLVKLHLMGRTIGPKGDTTYHAVDVSIRLMNSGLLHHTTCGEPPLFGRPVTATYVVGSSPSQVQVNWNPGLDESGGEKDVERYFIFRRPAAAAAFGDPVAIIPAGQPAYQFADLPPSAGDWVYAVAAEDCGAQNSLLSQSATVTTP